MYKGKGKGGVVDALSTEGKKPSDEGGYVYSFQ